MPRRCVVVDTGMGRAIVTMSVRKKDLCACGRLRTALCDFAMGGGKTCDRPICDVCRTHVGKNVDYCPEHRQQAGTQAGLFSGPQNPIEVK